jgi:hypothetical protein
MVLAEMHSADFGVFWSYPAENPGTSPKDKPPVFNALEEAGVIQPRTPAYQMDILTVPGKPG